MQLTKMPKYDAYKDSSVEWLGEIPEGWELVPIRNIFDFRNEKNDPVKTKDILSLSIANGVTKYSDENRGGNKRKEDLTAYKIARPNDIVMNSMNVIVGAVGISKYFGAISPVYYALSLKSAYTSISYYERIFQNEGFQRGLLKLGKGILIKISESGKMNTIRMKISQDDLKVLLFPKPNYQTQTLIAKFLDQKTAQIDKAIEIKHKQIELLKEQKQIVINNAVTKGLDPNAPMKDSGIEWIGEIPQGWEVRRLKTISRIVLGKMICNSNAGGMFLKPYLKSKNIQWLKVDISSVDQMWFTRAEMKEYKLHKDDLILSEGGEVGKTCIWNDELNECYIQNSAHKVTIDKDNFPFYYLYLFNHIGKQGGFDSIVNRVSIAHLTKEKLSNFYVLRPPFVEQKQIVAYIEEKTSKIDKAIELQNKQIDKLKEYKASLINSVVTGKVRVTDEMVEGV